MAKVLDKIGRIKCHCCGSLVVLKKQANGNPDIHMPRVRFQSAVIQRRFGAAAGCAVR
jgi:hypothetical protein